MLMMPSPASLTRYPPGGFREVASLSFPFIFVLFSGCLMGLCDRLILSRYSLQAVEGVVSALYLVQLFQIPCVRIASTAQIFVGQYKGAGKNENIGPLVWQMIWFSFFSIAIIIPLSLPISQMFFQDTVIQVESISYFRYLIAVNFLFPLGAALASFYLGQGQARKVIIASVISHLVHILLDFPLIFGVENFIPAFGVKGAAFSAAVAQLLFCSILLWNFLKPTHRQVYHTEKFSFHWAIFWRCLQIGIPRAGSKTIHLITWAAIIHIMIHKKEDYLAVLAFGGTLNLFYTCFNEGMSQALTTIGAYLIGAKQLLLWKLMRSAALFLTIGSLLLAIPCLFFPETLLYLFFKENPSPILRQELYLSCYWLWLLFITHGLNLICLGILNSYGDTMFQMLFTVTAAWMIQLIPTYLLIGVHNAPPNQLWLIAAIACLIAALTYFMRLRQEKWKTIPSMAVSE